MPSDEITLLRAQWTARQQAHHRRADELLAGSQVRRERGQPDPVDDFLFSYYRYRPAQIRRWHPGAFVVLEDAADAPHTHWPHYDVAADGSLRVDVREAVRQRSVLIGAVRRLLEATLTRAPQMSCFGLHEWAMIPDTDPHARRHGGVPLRLPISQISTVLDARGLRCTHFDAYRFFTASATPRNTYELNRANQADMEQPGCLHAGMDLYKWAYKLIPLTDSELLLDCFALARQIRTVDMQASPYDLQQWGISPIQVETAAGRAEYAALQREFYLAAQPLRERLLDVCRSVKGATDRAGASRTV